MNNKEKREVYAKEYYEKNRDYVISKAKNWYVKNKERCLARVKAYRINNNVYENYMKEYLKKYYVLHKDKLKAYANNYNHSPAGIKARKKYYEKNKKFINDRSYLNKKLKRELK